MPSDSVASFLDLARSQRLIPPEQVTDLFREADGPPAGLADLCDMLQRRGVLTPYQADLVRAGRVADLNFAGYPITGERGPCPGGTAYDALHPALRTPVVVRRLRADWLGPADNLPAFILRAQSASTFTHPHIANLLDAGACQDEPFVALEPSDGADLETLIRDIGPMPAALAASYGRQIALALAAAHERNLVHGHVRPAVAWVGPLVPMSKPRADGTPRQRPAAAATVRLCELGLVPHRPGLASADPDAPADGAEYLPPERLTATEFTPAGDVYGLGGTLYFLLTGRPPLAAATVGEAVTRLRDDVPPLLNLVRPDAPPALVKAVKEMMALDPAARPTAAAVADALAALAPQPPTAAAPPAPVEVPPSDDDIPLAVAAGPGPGVEIDLSDLPTPDGGGEPHRSPAVAPNGWAPAAYVPAPVAYAPAPVAFTPAPFGHAEAAADEADAGDRPARYRPQEPEPNKLALWLGVGGFLWVLSFGLWYFYIFRDPSPAPEPEPPPRKAPKSPARAKPRDAAE